MISLFEAIQFIRPTSTFSIRPDGTIIWYDASASQPTADEIEAAKKELEALAYKELRRRAYPLIGEQLDALWKGGTAFEEMKSQIQAVKAKYPKPQ